MRFVSGGASAGAVATVLTLMLAGCGGDPGPIVTHTPSGEPTESVVASATPTPSPTPTALTDEELLAMMPEGAEREDLIGAMVTAQFFLEQYSVMFQTGDTRVWEALSAEDCSPCSAAITSSSDLTRAGSEVTGGEIEVDASTLRGELKDDDGALLVLEAEFSESRIAEPDGSVRVSGTSGRLKYAVRTVLNNGVWRIADVATEDA